MLLDFFSRVLYNVDETNISYIPVCPTKSFTYINQEFKVKFFVLTEKKDVINDIYSMLTHYQKVYKNSCQVPTYNQIQKGNVFYTKLKKNPNSCILP